MQNPIGEAELEWILHRNCEGTEQLSYLINWTGKWIMLKKRMRQWITLCIVFAMLFSGMYFEKLKVDSQFVACNFPDNPAVIRAAEPTAVVAHYRKLSQEYRSVANTMEISSGRKNRSESVELRLLLLGAGLLSMCVWLTFLQGCQRLCHAAYSSFFIISYIHNRDGKKRICAC